MKHRTNQILFTYWNEIRDGRLAPRRFEIEPSRITGILADTFVLERIEASSFRYRLAGTRLCEMFGTEFRGRGFFDGWEAADSEQLVAPLNTMCTQGAVLCLDFEGKTAGGKKLALEAVLMPLVHAGDAVTRVLGAMGAADTPDWIGYEPLAARRLVRHELIWPDGRPHAVAERHRTAPPVFAPLLAGARHVHAPRRHFRVLDGGLTKPGALKP
jgi:hypothetical protein